MKVILKHKRHFIATGFLFSVILITLIALISSASAQPPEITNGLNYLTSTQNPDGSWGSGTANTKMLSSSVEVVKTFQILNHTENTYYSNALLWLQGQTIDTTDYLSERIYALSVAGNDRDLLLSYIDQMTHAWGGHDDYQDNNFDTAMALLALNTINYQDSYTIESALAYLFSNQNIDGGWGFDEADESNVYMTAVVLKIVALYNGIYDFQILVDNAASYLVAHQNADGGFGSSPSTVYETALAFDALLTSKANLLSVAPSAKDYLNTTQFADGSWEEDAYSTALALRALANTKPNLTITPNDIIFSNTTPTVGETIDITATVHNDGPESAGSITIAFYDGDPDAGGVFIDEFLISLIPEYGSASLTISWMIPTASPHTIFIKVDPANTIEELDETDNMSNKQITSATLPDLSITSGEIVFSSLAPLSGDPVTITATVRNIGETEASNVTLDIYNGDPASGGTLLGNTTFSSVGLGESATFNLTTSFTDGNHDIYVVADQSNSIVEGNEANNIAIRTLVVGERLVDLLLTGMDISYSPANPVEGDIITINAIIRNEGEMQASNVLVRFYLGDPDSGGTQIGTDTNIPSILARGIAAVNTTWDSTGHAGNNDIYVKVDPLDTVLEISEQNNKAYKTIKVAAQTGPDLTVASTDITFNPLNPNTGDLVIITANIGNIGDEDASNVFVEFSVGDPNVGGTLILGSQTVSLIEQNSSAIAEITWDTTRFSGTYEVYVNVDTFNDIAELDETNNLAYAPLTVQGPQGPDLYIESLSKANLATDIQSLEVSGSIQVTLENRGNQDTAQPFEITVFEDKNYNEVLDSGIDNILGASTYSGTLLSETTDSVDISLSGDILFRDNLIYVYVDSLNAVDEIEETNNIINTGLECDYAPRVREFNPVEKWTWTGNSSIPGYNQVIHTPVVGRIADTNGDGLIDDTDVPAVIFVATPGPCPYGCSGFLVAVRGDTGEEILIITDYELPGNRAPAIGDIDGDGMIEIVSMTGANIAAFEHDGQLKWSTFVYQPQNIGALSIADLDADGVPEIIGAATVLDNEGNIKWRGTGGIGLNTGLRPATFAADVDLDGYLEVVAGNTVYRHDGTIYWQNTSVGDGFNAVANFDDDPYPEIVLVWSHHVTLLEHTGEIKWGPYHITQRFPRYVNYGGPPTVADFDGDGQPEIGVSSYFLYTVFDTDGTILYQFSTYDYSSSATAATVFDFEGDGNAEIVYSDEKKLRIHDGKTGIELFSIGNSSGTGIENPTVADIDNDNRAEIVICANDWLAGTPRTHNGIRAFEDANDTWVNTRNIWNQYSYHITNVNDDLTIPQYQENNWDTYNNFRCNPILPDDKKSDITASYISVDQTHYPVSATISVRIGNGGAMSQPEGVEVAFYDGDPLQGGILLGTSHTTIELNKGEYEDISIIWNNPSYGTHNIFVSADKDNIVDECRELNNTVSVEVTIEPAPPDYLPDLSISQEDITIVPPNVIEGQDAGIGVVVHNEGNVIAYNIEIAFYDGSASTGDLIGTASITSIDLGGTSYVQVPWSTYGQSGRNYIHVIADPQNLIQEQNENNNESLVSIDVAPPTMPDLTVTSTDIVFSNQAPKEGDSLTITVTVHNIGTATGTIKVNLYDGDPGSGGALLNTYTILPIIPFGGLAAITFNIDTIGFTGNHSFHVVVDPDNTIAEQKEDNNNASLDLLIGTIGLDITATTDKTQYNENEDVQITVNVTDLQNETRELQVDVKVFDANGYLVASLDAVSVTVNPLATETLNFTWNTGATLIGNYSIRTTVYDSGTMNPVARESVPINISASAGISSNIVLDKISYNANEQITITSTVTNDSVNEIYEDLTSTVTIQDGLSQVLFTEDISIDMLAPGAYQSFNLYWNTATNPSGDYPVTLEVKDASGTVLSTSTKTLTITDVIDPSALLIGNISVDTQSLFQGDPVNISYSITNVGNIDLSQIDLSILTVHVVELTPYDTLTDQTALLMGETYNNTQLLNTPTYSAKDYLVVLRANISGTEESLASTYFRVEGAPSAPSLSSPGQGDDVETYTPVLEVNNSSDPNDDELTYEFELYSDSGLTNLVSSSGILEEGEGVTSWQVPVELVENETYYWRARAYDQLLYGEWMTIASFRVNVYNDSPTAPTLSSPANTSEVDTFTPILVVNNSYDPDSTGLTYNFEVASDPDFLNIVTFKIGVFEGDGTTSWQVPDSILSENTHYYWRVQADDWLDVSEWMTTAMFFVNTANDAPSAPAIISPENDSEIAILSTDITVSNSTDPDYDPLTYFFQIDTVNTFDSPNLTQSGNIPEGSLTTSWYVEGLFDNTYHYVRALADDSLAQSPWSGTIRFFTNTANDAPAAPVLANPSNGAGVSVYNPTLSVHNSEDIDLDVLTYDFEVYDNTMTSLITSATGVEEAPDITSWTVPLNLTENEIYTWRAKAYDGELYSGWMPFASFMINTANDAPSAPTLNAPAEGSSIETEYPTLSVNNATDPDSDTLTYDFEIYTDGILVDSFTGIPEDDSGITSVTLMNALSDNTTYTWKARAYDGDRYGAWMDTATFTVHLPIVNITATIDFDPNTLDQKSKGKWVTVYIELPAGYDVNDIIVSSILLENTVPVEPWPYAIEDYDNDGIPDLKVKFRRSDVIDILPAGDHVPVLVTGELATVTFDGIDIIRVIH